MMNTVMHCFQDSFIFEISLNKYSPKSLNSSVYMPKTLAKCLIIEIYHSALDVGRMLLLIMSIRDMGHQIFHCTSTCYEWSISA